MGIDKHSLSRSDDTSAVQSGGKHEKNRNYWCYGIGS